MAILFVLPSAAFAAAMQWGVGSGLIIGTDTTHLSPRGQLTRAQTATIFARLPSALHAGQALDLQTEDARARSELIDSVTAVADRDSSDYIPAEDRVAVFDMNGTLE